MYRSFTRFFAAALLAVGLLSPGRGVSQPVDEDIIKELERRLEEERADDGDITLRHKFRPGKILMGEYRAITEARMTDGKKREDTMEDVVVNILIKDLSEDRIGGGMIAETLEMTILRVKARDQNGPDKYFDSGVPADLSRAELKKWSAHLYRPFRCWVAHAYPFIKIDTRRLAENVAAQLKIKLTPDEEDKLSKPVAKDVEKMLKLVFIFLPPTPVKRGGVHPALLQQIDMGAIGSVSFHSQYGFSAEPGKTGVEEISVTGSLDRAVGMQVESSSYAGRVIFDARKGHVTQAENEIHIAFACQLAPRTKVRMKTQAVYTLSRVKDS
ncbi:MAG: hypothetical protein JXD23_15010 [Spirochaetales bacterium]|nr:hypothetical protein [Spirochaetales bacterium]